MAAIPQSPAVVFIEKDNSSYPPNIDSSIVGLVGYASKGPTNKPTLITSQANLVTTFGDPGESIVGQGLEGAIEILETTNQLRYVRAVPSDAKDASALIQMGTSPAIGFSLSSFGLTRSLYLRVSVTDSEGNPVITDKEYSIPASTDNVSEGISQASAIAKIIGDGNFSKDPLAVVWDSDSENTGYLVGSFAGSGASLTVYAYSNSTFTTPLACLHLVGYNGESSQNTPSPTPSPTPIFPPVGGPDYIIDSRYSVMTVYGTSIKTNSLAYLTKSLYPGNGYNLGVANNTGQTSGISIELQGLASGRSNLVVNLDGIAYENYNVSLQSGDEFIEKAINVGVDNAISDYIKGELYFNGSTNLITPIPLQSFASKINNLGLTNINVVNYTGSSVNNVTPRFVKPVAKTTSMLGGTNGTMTSYDGIIGTQSAKSGIYALDDDVLNISMAAVPGIHNQAVQNALITLAETSMNFIAAVAPPYGLDTVEEAIDWMNGRGNGRTAAINNSWTTVCWPHVQVFSVYDKKDRWYDPSIFALRQMAYTDNVAEPWFAAAGYRRGRLTKPTATEKSLNQGDRDALYSNNINPIANFNPDGITIFGQKTAQRLATALDRVNIRRLMIYLRKVLLQTGRVDLFEPNDEFTWESVKSKAELLLGNIQSRRGITDFRVICDATTNTPLRVDRNELWCKILLKPTKTAEWIVFEVNLTSQAAKLNG